MANKVKSTYTFTHVYDDYTKEIIPELQEKEGIHRAILTDFCVKATKAILLEAKVLSLPYIGDFRIKKKKTSSDRRKMKVDFHLTKKLGFTVYHSNEHRDGYHYSWHWNKKIFKNRRNRSFKACRHNTRSLSTILQKYDKSQIDYPE